MNNREIDRYSNVDLVHVIKVIQVNSYFGEGTKGEPGRAITEYYSMNGALLARVDNWLCGHCPASGSIAQSLPGREVSDDDQRD